MSQEIDILTPRRQQILGIVVRRYVEAALPVSSKAVSASPDLNVSSATVRNEMAYLEDHGYLTHPHTSAGRVPTVQGYRFFVDTLLSVKPLESGTVNELRAQLDVDTSSKDLLESATGLLSGITQLAGVVTVGIFAHRPADLLILGTPEGPKVIEP